MTALAWTYFQGLLVTILIEVPIVSLVFRAQWQRMALACLVATTLTHTVMHFALPPLLPTLTLWVILGEALALSTEAAIYGLVSKPRSVPRAIVASALANSLSFATGLGLFSGGGV